MMDVSGTAASRAGGGGGGVERVYVCQVLVCILRFASAPVTREEENWRMIGEHCRRGADDCDEANLKMMGADDVRGATALCKDILKAGLTIDILKSKY